MGDDAGIHHYVSYRYLEPLSFKAAGEPHPTAVGPSSHSKTSPYPLPTTLLGAMFTCLGLYGDEQYDEWFEAYTRNINPPLARVGTLHACIGGEPYLVLSQGLLRPSEGRAQLEKVKVFQVTRVSLDDSTRTAREGYLFSASMLAMPGAKLAVEVVFNAGLGSHAGKPCPLGGYSRTALLEVEELGERGERDRKTFCGKKLVENYASDQDTALLLVATPILFSGERLGEAYAAGLNGSSVAELLRRMGIHVDDEVASVLGALRIAAPSKIYVAPMSAGWDYRLNRRRPYYMAVLPGSYLTVKTEGRGSLKGREEMFYWEGVGVASHIGFGRLAPLPSTLLPALRK